MGRLTLWPFTGFGVFSVHVDDGIGGGDQIFEDKIRQLVSISFREQTQAGHDLRRIAYTPGPFRSDPS